MDKGICITLDGESGTGKSTLAGRLSQKFNFNFLPSGCIYRWYAWCIDQGFSHHEIILMSNDLSFVYRLDRLIVHFNNKDISNEIMMPDVAIKASNIAQNEFVRNELLPLQRSFYSSRGLIAEGRDMASVVFPDAQLHIYLITCLEIRAARRHKQLLDQGLNVSINKLKKKLKDRDMQDKSRSAAPLTQVETSKVLDTGNYSLDECLNILGDWIVKELHG